MSPSPQPLVKPPAWILQLEEWRQIGLAFLFKIRVRRKGSVQSKTLVKIQWIKGKEDYLAVRGVHCDYTPLLIHRTSPLNSSWPVSTLRTPGPHGLAPNPPVWYRTRPPVSSPHTVHLLLPAWPHSWLSSHLLLKLKE